MVVKEKTSTKKSVKKTTKKTVKTLKKEVPHVEEQHYSDDVV
jgi:hypothetical protein